MADSFVEDRSRGARTQPSGGFRPTDRGRRRGPAGLSCGCGPPSAGRVVYTDWAPVSPAGHRRAAAAHEGQQSYAADSGPPSAVVASSSSALEAHLHEQGTFDPPVDDSSAPEQPSATGPGEVERRTIGSSSTGSTGSATPRSVVEMYSRDWGATQSPQTHGLHVDQTGQWEIYKCSQGHEWMFNRITGVWFYHPYDLAVPQQPSATGPGEGSDHDQTGQWEVYKNCEGREWFWNGRTRQWFLHPQARHSVAAP